MQTAGVLISAPGREMTMAVITATAGQPFNADALTLVDFSVGVNTAAASSTHFTAGPASGLHADVTGVGFAYDPLTGPVTGVVTGFSEFNGSTLLFQVTGASTPVAAYESHVKAGDSAGALALLLAGASTITGSSGADVLRAGAGSATLNGGAGNDVLIGGPGDDTLNGGPGADNIEGGGGVNTLVLTGTAANYSIVHDPVADVYTVTDLRPGSPDGTDTVHDVQFVLYNTQVAPLLTAKGQAVRNDFTAVLRGDPLHGYDTVDFSSLVSQVETGVLAIGSAAQQVVSLAAATTSVGVLAYQFFTGSTPSSAGLDYLTAPDGGNPDNLNSSYYQSFTLENRYINFAVNLGKFGAGADAFALTYGALSVFDATRLTYTQIFGVTPSDDKLHAILDGRTDYFTALGGADLQNIGEKAAVVGWLLAEAVKAGVGTYATAEQSYLTDLASGLPTYGIDLVGTYHGTPLTGG